MNHRERAGTSRLAIAALSGAGLLLAWQIVVQATADRLPVAAAVKFTPGSGRLLALSAEAEFEAGRTATAEALARAALRAQPLNARALRVLGLGAARRGEADLADQMVTQAGNWSLRDGPAHAWLVERRLHQGDYASAFAHADALMRRTPEVHPQLFNLMATAVAADPRALPPVAERLTHEPSWRAPFLQDLASRPDGLEAAAALAIMLSSGRAPLNDGEAGALLSRLVKDRRFAAAAALRRRLAPAEAAADPFDGEFDRRSGPAPFRWLMGSGPGAAAEIAPDDLAPNQSALRVEYDGYSAAPDLVVQFMALPAGAYELEGRWRSETPIPADRLAWVLTCAEDSRVVARSPQPAATEAAGWRSAKVSFKVPDRGCEGQWLRLRPSAGDRRTTLVVWYDGLTIRPSS